MHLRLTLLTALLLTPLDPLSAAEPSIRLAENGTARHAIVIDAAQTATEAERFAAEELALFLKKVTGAAFPIVKEGEHAGPGIYVGHTRKAAEAGIDHGTLGDEEWVLQSTGNDLILTGGRPRGTLYAVYEFLDSKAGCRWIAPDIEIVPANRDFAITALDVRGRPASILVDHQHFVPCFSIILKTGMATGSRRHSGGLCMKVDRQMGCG